MYHTSPTPEECYATIVEELLSNANVTPPQAGKGFGSSELKVHGKIFAMLSRGKLVVKLPKLRVDALVAAGAGERFDPRRDGRLMKEWIIIASMSTEEWLALTREAMAFVASKVERLP